jgi:RNA polymerase sigma factor (sigma-70 family)
MDPATDIVEGEQVVLNQTVHRLLGRLRDEEKAAILLHYRHGLTQQEIATALGQALGTVKSLIRRAREKMKQHYDSRSEEPSCEKSPLQTNSG